MTCQSHRAGKRQSRLTSKPVDRTSPKSTGFILLSSTTLEKNHLLPGPVQSWATTSQGQPVRSDSPQQKWFHVKEAEASM